MKMLTKASQVRMGEWKFSGLVENRTFQNRLVNGDTSLYIPTTVREIDTMTLIVCRRNLIKETDLLYYVMADGLDIDQYCRCLERDETGNPELDAEEYRGVSNVFCDKREFSCSMEKFYHTLIKDGKRADECFSKFLETAYTVNTLLCRIHVMLVTDYYDVLLEFLDHIGVSLSNLDISDTDVRKIPGKAFDIIEKMDVHWKQVPIKFCHRKPADKMIRRFYEELHKAHQELVELIEAVGVVDTEFATDKLGRVFGMLLTWISVAAGTREESSFNLYTMMDNHSVWIRLSDVVNILGTALKEFDASGTQCSPIVVRLSSSLLFKLYKNILEMMGGNLRIVADHDYINEVSEFLGFHKSAPADLGDFLRNRPVSFYQMSDSGITGSELSLHIFDRVLADDIFEAHVTGAFAGTAYETDHKLELCSPFNMRNTDEYEGTSNAIDALKNVAFIAKKDNPEPPKKDAMSESEIRKIVKATKKRLKK